MPAKAKKSGSLSRQQIKDRIDRHELDLSLCELSEVPVKDLEQFGDLRQLVQLDLSKNNLACLPQSIGRLDSLRKLDLYSNRLSSLPLSFSQLTSLKWLDLKSNPLDGDLAKVAGTCTTSEDCQKCAKDILAFIRAAASRAEREHQQRLEVQRQAELRQRKLDAEKAAELRRQKQLEKQQRREKHEQERRQQQEEEEAARQREGESNGQTSQAELNRSLSSETTGSQPAGRSCLCYFFAILLLLLLGACAGLAVFCSQDTATCQQWQAEFTHTLNDLPRTLKSLT